MVEVCSLNHGIAIVHIMGNRIKFQFFSQQHVGTSFCFSKNSAFSVFATAMITMNDGKITNK